MDIRLYRFKSVSGGIRGKQRRLDPLSGGDAKSGVVIEKERLGRSRRRVVFSAGHGGGEQQTFVTGGKNEKRKGAGMLAMKFRC